ncbi:hypothetical protein Cgig2_010086 [Carnegiea gigantea]|uniref:Uncharacterized protein n=1 Tax=Carnegiea gigantea TaxID=171969 RepID=A0A9Q1K4S7_9CARY|nr:hypothetical protein Cgig2_010086 [Carnegiea gigantea]
MKELHFNMDEKVITGLIIGVQTPRKVLTLLIERRHWGSTFQFRGRSTFMIGVMEWTKRVLSHFKEPLKQAGIFGAVAFCELWGLLTNTLHHSAGKVSISLYDLERIEGLPILGAIYEEFLLLNKDLTGHNKYHATVAELLCIHAELCRFHKVNHIYYDLWLDHFYREYLVCFAYGEQTNSEQEKFKTKKKAPFTSRLSRFVLPHALGYIYHGLGEIARYPDHPGKANTNFPIHYSYFLLYTVAAPISYYAGLLGSKLSLPQARYVFKDGRALRQQRNVMDLTQAYADLQRRDTGAWFYIAPSHYKGLYQGETFSVILDLLASRARVSQSLSALCSMIDIYNLGTIEICWLSSKIEEIFGVVEIAAKIEDLVDVDRVLLEAEGNLKSFLDPKKKEAEQLKADLVEAGFVKLQDLEKEKNHLKSLIGSVISFNNV